MCGNDISPNLLKNQTVYNSQGKLLHEIQAKGYEVLVTSPDRTDMEIPNLYFHKYRIWLEKRTLFLWVAVLLADVIDCDTQLVFV